MELRDLLFGAGVLKKAAEGPPAATAPALPAQPSGIDMQAEALKAAARAGVKPASPASTTPAPAAAPVKPAAPAVKKKPAAPTVSQHVGNQFMETQ